MNAGLIRSNSRRVEWSHWTKSSNREESKSKTIAKLNQKRNWLEVSVRRTTILSWHLRVWIQRLFISPSEYIIEPYQFMINTYKCRTIYIYGWCLSSITIRHEKRFYNHKKWYINPCRHFPPLHNYNNNSWLVSVGEEVPKGVKLWFSFFQFYSQDWLLA